jgi:cytochrome oxidase Cu insertion factor (SCO1/SenC/PrrC family)
MAREEAPSKFVRMVKPYKRKMFNKVVRVRGYQQSYQQPRGPVKRFAVDKLKKHSQTMWLMDRYGRFIGRANYEGETSAQGISKYGYDTTKTIRDAKKYKRIFGRVPSEKRKIVRR